MFHVYFLQVFQVSLGPQEYLELWDPMEPVAIAGHQGHLDHKVQQNRTEQILSCPATLSLVTQIKTCATDAIQFGLLKTHRYIVANHTHISHTYMHTVYPTITYTRRQPISYTHMYDPPLTHTLTHTHTHKYMHQHNIKTQLYTLVPVPCHTHNTNIHTYKGCLALRDRTAGQSGNRNRSCGRTIS